ncbi:MAG: elongation factor P [Candidatus Latescibacterota bacterium]|nr:MAG: elongation factor P [Candidatus Latescibacterota bacterium]RKY72276.1 MAG: elongation factor P [Candidatus Latescibacterota bacterium]
MATTSEFRNGMVIRLEGELFTIVEFQHVKPGKGMGFVRTRLKNVRTGAVLDRTFRSGEQVEEVRLERREMQFLYRSDDMLYFMDTETYEQFSVPVEAAGDAVLFLKEGEAASVFMDGDTPVGVEVPYFVELKVVETEPGVRGDTATGGSKPAKLETGLVVQVPLFVEEGDTVKVDTRTREYIERV